MRENIINWLGIVPVTGWSIISLAEKLQPVLAVTGLLLGCAVSITVLIINKKKSDALDRQKDIDNSFLNSINNYNK